jgi:hypothetical protein
VRGTKLSKRILILIGGIFVLAILSVNFAGKLPNQTSIMITIPQTQFIPLSEISNSNYSITNATWNLHTYYSAASFSSHEAVLQINGTIDSSLIPDKKPSVFLETTDLNINGTLPYLSLDVEQNSSVALIVRLGVNLSEWLHATNDNSTLAKLRNGGVINDVIWVMWQDYPLGKTGSLESIWGSGEQHNISINWKDYLHEALNYNFTSIKGLQIILGFANNTSSFSSTLRNIVFSNQPEALTPIQKTLQDNMFIVSSQEIEPILKQNFFPERAHVIFQMTQAETRQFMTFIVWKNANGSLLMVRNGFELQSVDGPESLWVDFWNVVNNVNAQPEDPLSALFGTLNNNDFAVVFLALPPNGNNTLNTRLQQIDLYLSKPGLAAAVTNQFNINDVFNATTLYLFVVGVVPLVLLITFYAFRKYAERKPRFWIILVILSGIIVRFVLAPTSSHQADVLQFSDIGALFFGQKSFFNFWVDFPLYYYPMVTASLPYSIIRASGFMDSSYLAVTSYVWQMVTIKLVPIIADVVAYIYLYRLFGKSRNKLFDLGPEIYFLGPMVILTSATWAHLNSVFIALLIIGFYYAKKGRLLLSVFFFSLATMTIPVGFIAVLGVVIASLLLKEYKLTTKMLAVSVSTFIVLILPMVLSSNESLSSLVQRLTVGQVVNSPVYGPSPVVIGGATVYPFMTTGYKFLRLLEVNHIALPQFFLSAVFLSSIICATIWFIRRSYVHKKSIDFHSAFLFEDVASYTAVAFACFLLFYSTSNFIWNVWPVFALILMLSFKKRSSLAILAIIYSFVLLLGFEFVEHLSFLATGYTIQYFDYLGLKLDYFGMNIAVSFLFSLLAFLVALVALQRNRVIPSFIINSWRRLFQRKDSA